MDSSSHTDKQTAKIERKLLKLGTTLGDVLPEEGFLQMFRANNPLLHSFLKLRDYRDMVTYLTVVGTPEDKIRSYKLPQVAADILSSEIPRILDVMYSIVEEQNSLSILQLLLKYFEGEPNDTLSGYVIRVITPLYTYEPARTQKAVMESGQLKNIVAFMSSRSVTDFVIRLIVVEAEALLNTFFKERKELFLHLLQLYERGQGLGDYLAELSYALGEIIGKLWNQKHKELGKMAPTIMKAVETVLTKVRYGLCNQEALLSTIMTNLVRFPDNAAYLIKMVVSKAFANLSIGSKEQVKTANKTLAPKLGTNKLWLLKCLSLAFVHSPKVVQELPNIHTYLQLLLGLVARHEWNSLVHVEVETIVKEVLKSNNPEVFKALFHKWSLTHSLRELTKRAERNSKGYSGLLTNLFLFIKEIVDTQTDLGKYIQLNQQELIDLSKDYLKPKEQLYSFHLGGFKTNPSKSPPQFDQESLLRTHREFLQPSSIHEEVESLSQVSKMPSSIPEEMLEQMENENLINSTRALKPPEKV